MSIISLQGMTQLPVLKGDGSSISQAPPKDQQAKEPVPVREPSPRKASQADAAKEEERLKAATDLLNEFMNRASIALHFSTDSESGQIVVKVRSKQTGELIRQIPSEVALKLSKALDTLRGLIIEDKV